ncbi:MAG: MBL fold metallo-hydrolase, partial [Steroidobacteraceae bacterium]
MSGRRRFLKTLVGGAAGLSVPYLLPGEAFARSRSSDSPGAAAGAAAGVTAGAAAGSQSASGPVTVTRLTERLAFVSGAGGNVAVLSGPDGVLLVDSGGMGRTHELLEAVSGLPGGHHINTVFNTHWHWAHTGGNEALAKAGAKLVAHENTRLWLGETIRVDWQHRTYEPRPKAAWPTETFYTTGSMSFGGEPIEYGYLPEAHTDGDIYVYFKGQNVLVPGCVLAVGRYPIIDYTTDGWLGGMSAATQRLAGMIDAQTQIVPGVGPVQTRADLLAEHAMLADLQNVIWHMMLKGLGPPDILAAHATARYDAKWGDPSLFVHAAYRSLYAHCRELRGAI